MGSEPLRFFLSTIVDGNDCWNRWKPPLLAGPFDQFRYHAHVRGHK